MILLLGFSFFFSLTETVLASLDKFKIRELKEKNPSLMLGRLLQTPSWWLTDILVGNNLVNIVFTILAISIAVDFAYKLSVKRELVVGITVILVTAVILIFGEIIPKTLARLQTIRFFSLVFKPFLIVDRILSPIRKLLMWITQFFVKPKKEQEEKTRLTKKELYFLLRAGRKEGALEKEEEEMICRVLGLRDISVNMIMTTRDKIEAIPLPKTKDKEDLLDQVMEIGRSRIPVYKDNLENVKGILYAKDLLLAIKGNVSFQIATFLHPPFFISPDTKISELFRELNIKKTHIALIREAGILKGLITMEDILEEIVGEILDEYDLAGIKKR